MDFIFCIILVHLIFLVINLSFISDISFNSTTRIWVFGKWPFSFPETLCVSFSWISWWEILLFLVSPRSFLFVKIWKKKTQNHEMGPHAPLTKAAWCPFSSSFPLRSTYSVLSPEWVVSNGTVHQNHQGNFKPVGPWNPSPEITILLVRSEAWVWSFTSSPGSPVGAWAHPPGFLKQKQSRHPACWKLYWQNSGLFVSQQMPCEKYQEWRVAWREQVPALSKPSSLTQTNYGQHMDLIWILIWTK